MQLDRLNPLSKDIIGVERKGFSVFPNLNTEGFYDFFSQVIILNSIERRQVDRLNEAQESGTPLELYHANKCILPLMHHEYTHWLDNCSTLWGLNFLNELWECYSIGLKEIQKGPLESEYFKKKSLIDRFSRIKFPRYYSTKGDSCQKNNWKYEYSVGKLFDKNGFQSNTPILFARFSDNADSLVARQPISLASIFECSATFQEIGMSSGLLSLLDGPEQLIESKLFQAEIKEKLYAKEFTEYTAAAHVLANAFSKVDVIETYQMATALSRLVLNFPSSSFEKINSFAVYGKDSSFSIAFEEAFRSKDRAFLYFYIIQFISRNYDHQSVTPKSINDILNKAFKELDVDLKESEMEAENEIKKSAHALGLLGNPYLNNLALAALANYKQLGFYGKTIYDPITLKVPGVVLGDNTYFNPYGFFEQNVEDRYIALSSFEDHLSAFSEACIS